MKPRKYKRSKDKVKEVKEVKEVKKKKKLRIAVLSDSPMIPTGYRNQMLPLANYLTEQGHEVHYMGNAFTGMPLNNFELHDGTKCDFKLYGDMGQTYFQHQMTDILKDNMIDKFIILLDTFMLHGQDGWFLRTDTSPAKTFFWFPSDGGGGMPNGCANILNKIDQPVAMAEFGQKQVKDYYNLDVAHIPHGCDTTLFHKLPLQEQLDLKKKYGLEDKFVVGVVARNQPRKNLDRTLKTIRLLKDKIPNLVLFLHMDPDDPAQPLWRMKSLVRKFGIENRVIFSGMSALKGFPTDQMNEIYNVMDCFFLSTSGEGFGIPIIEAMACEVPVVATDYTTTPELVIKNNAGLGIELAGCDTVDMMAMDSKEYDSKTMNGTITGSWEVERGICDINSAANQIIKLYNDPILCKRLGQNGRNAVLKKYDFQNVVAPAWLKLLEE